MILTSIDAQQPQDTGGATRSGSVTPKNPLKISGTGGHKERLDPSICCPISTEIFWANLV
jgi:hypothetical protein